MIVLSFPAHPYRILPNLRAKYLLDKQHRLKRLDKTKLNAAQGYLHKPQENLD